MVMTVGMVTLGEVDMEELTVDMDNNLEGQFTPSQPHNTHTHTLTGMAEVATNSSVMEGTTISERFQSQHTHTPFTTPTLPPYNTHTHTHTHPDYNCCPPGKLVVPMRPSNKCFR